MTKLFSTSRGVREYYANYQGKSVLLPKAITIAEFEAKAIFVKNRNFIDSDSRLLLLRDAVDFKEYKKLQFSPEFMTFLNHSKYIFTFFDELASEEIDISTLKEYDMYALYDEHLEALEILKHRYISLLDKNGLVDRVNLGDLYEINEDYLKNLGGVEFVLDGFLSKFEINLFQKCAKIIPFYMDIELNNYNKKVATTFKNIGIDLEVGKAYRLNLSEKTISTCRALENTAINAVVDVFQIRLSQIGFIFSTIQRFYEEGLEADDIVVVLPDEGLAPFLKEFDRYKNLNFAMGFSLENSNLYKRLEAIELYMKEKKDEQFKRLERLNIEDTFLQKLQIIWRQKQDREVVLSILNDILTLDENELKDNILKEEIFRFESFLLRLEKLTLEQSFRLFLKRLKEKNEDDIRGGKITVMGLLETRGGKFDGVIVPDFSDDFVPKHSNKDLFLNTTIRKNVGLPIMEDRENLQKYYYNSLFKNAKKVAISTVSNETTMPSRFLDELGLSFDKSKNTQAYNSLLFDNPKNYLPKVREIKDVSYRLDSQALSATKLDVLLTCKRKFYFKYIQKLDEPRNILESSNTQVGLKIHKALERVFTKDFEIDNAAHILALLKKELICGNVHELEEFELESWLSLLKTFISNEKRRYDEGYRIYANELSLNSTFEGFEIRGKLDRIDKKDGKLFVIDYKSGDVSKLLRQKIENTTNFQLEFYYILATELGKVEDVFYYDLKGGKLESEPTLQAKLEKLKIILKELKEPITTFDMCEKKSSCLFCPYKKLCLREN